MPKYLIRIVSLQTSTNHTAEGKTSLDAAATLLTMLAKDYNGAFVHQIDIDNLDLDIDQHNSDSSDD